MTIKAGYTYLKERGLTDETIREMQPVFLTKEPTEEENALFKRYMRESRQKNSGECRKIVEGLLIPYLTIDEPYRDFGRSRVIVPSESLTQYYQKRNEDIPKFLSPASYLLKDQPGVHLYQLPHDAEKQGKSKDVILLTEGEVKAAALSQVARSLDDTNNNHVAIGAGGVTMFLPAPEWKSLSLKDKRVYLFFDGDSYDKKEVMQAELKLFFACLVKGARSVLSCCWPIATGKGIDDHLAASRPDQAAVLRILMDNAVSPLRKYANPPVEQVQRYQLDSLAAEIVKEERLKPFQRSMLVQELFECYKEQGITKKDIRKELDAAIRKREQQTHDTTAIGRYQEFQIDFHPTPLEEFDMSNGQLCWQEHPLCNMFVISKYVYTEDPEKEDSYVLDFRNKTLILSSDVQSNYKGLAKVFNQNREILFDGSAKLIQKYISQFWLENQEHIKKVPLYENTGWSREGFFQLPGITAKKNDAVYSADMERKFTPYGERAEQYELLEELLTRHHAGLITVIGLAAPCLGLFNLPRYAVVIYGGPGTGKTKGCEAAISQYGDPEHLMFSMDSTKVGKEITFSLYRDLPIILDEFNTASNDGRKIAQSVVETIYGFDQGKGRTRGNVKITHKEIKEFRGLVFLTSERSLESIFSVTSNMSVGGAYRRTLEIPVLDEHELWSIDKQQESETQFFSRIHNHIRKHYGHIGVDWLTHITENDVQDRLAYAYNEALNALLKKGHGNLKGTEKLIALVWAVMVELELFLQIPDNKIQKNLASYLNAITERQCRQIEMQVTDEIQRFKEAIETFIAMHVTGFEGICPEKAIMSQVFGKVEYTDTLTHIYLRAWAFKQFCNEFGFERDVLIPKLEAIDYCRRKDGNVYFNMSINSTKGQTYWFCLPSDDTGEFLNDAKHQNTHQQKTDQTDAAPFYLGGSSDRGNNGAGSTGSSKIRGKEARAQGIPVAEQQTFLQEQTATPWK